MKILIIIPFKNATYLDICFIYNSHKIFLFYFSLTTPHFIEVPVPNQESEQSCLCVLGVSILPLSEIFPLDFGIVQTMWYFLFFILSAYIFICEKFYKNESSKQFKTNIDYLLTWRSTTVTNSLTLFKWENFQ